MSYIIVIVGGRSGILIGVRSKSILIFVGKSVTTDATPIIVPGWETVGNNNDVIPTAIQIIKRVSMAVIAILKYILQSLPERSAIHGVHICDMIGYGRTIGVVGIVGV
jgi:hypothetical protein